jgi:hypothetical protein
MVETTIPLPTSRSYPLSVENALIRRRIFTVTRAFLAVGYAILLTRIRFALWGDIDRRRNYPAQSSRLRTPGGWANDDHPEFT